MADGRCSKHPDDHAPADPNGRGVLVVPWDLENDHGSRVERTFQLQLETLMRCFYPNPEAFDPTKFATSAWRCLMM